MQSLEPKKLTEASPLFRNMQPYEAEAMLARLQPSRYEHGARILQQSVWHGQLYIISSGQVSVLLREEEEAARNSPSPYVVATLGPGECFGEMSLITGEPPNATIRAEQDVALWSLTQADFLALMSICPTLLQNINTILSQRLTRTNQHLLSQHAAEILWLAFMNHAPSAVERSLALHIADMLAMRTRKRVLLLELCESETATGSHFGTSAGQLRPSLLECIKDRTHLQAHRAPTLLPDGQWIPAVASLAQTYEQTLALDASVLAALVDLAPLYEYVLLVTTPRTPAPILQALVTENQSVSLFKRAIALVPAEMAEQFSASSFFVQHSSRSYTMSVFITDAPEPTTIGAQDRYAQQIGCSVTRLLPANDALLERCWEQRTALSQQAPEAPLTRAVDFVARYIAHQTVGIAFGGGGARGFAHLGVLEGLLSHGVPLDYIAACSSGIITPGMYLIGKSFAESEEIFLQIQRHIVHWSIPRTSIFSNKGLKRMLREMCGERRFEDLTTPFAMVAVDLARRAGVVLDRGPLWLAGLASVALPGIFPPVLVGEHILMDAGMHDPVPLRLVRKMGADILLASELGGQEPPALESATPWFEETLHSHQAGQATSPHIIDLLLRTYDLSMATIGMHSIREADVVIRPKLHRISLRQFSEGRKFIVSGREAVEQALPALRERLPWVK